MSKEEAKQEPVAIRYDFDGYGWQYIDSGSGSNWRERVKHLDAEPLFTHPAPVDQALQTITDFDQMREATEVLARCIAELEAALDVALEALKEIAKQDNPEGDIAIDTIEKLKEVRK